jgi:hypothetical protein
MTRSFIIYTRYQTLLRYKIKETEMDRAHNTHGKQKSYTKFYSGSLKGRDYLRDLDVGGRIILEWI